MTNQDLYLPIELAKQIQPIAERFGIEADAGFYYDEIEGKWVFLEAIGVEDIVIGFIPTFRADRREATQAKGATMSDLLRAEYPGTQHPILRVFIDDGQVCIRLEDHGTPIAMQHYCSEQTVREIRDIFGSIKHD